MVTAAAPREINTSYKGVADPEIEKVFYDILAGAPSFTDHAIVDTRGPFTKLVEVIEGPGDESVKTSYVDMGDFKIKMFVPPNVKDNGPAILYIHGGGWIFGNVDSDSGLLSRWAAQFNCVIASVGYRLCPENPYSACVQDVIKSWDWITSTRPHNIDLSRLAAGGCSAGGCLALTLNNHLIDVNHKHRPCLNILWVPVCNSTLTPENSEYHAKYKHQFCLPWEAMLRMRETSVPDKNKWSDPTFSPALWKGDFSKYPKTFFLIGEADLLAGEAFDMSKTLQKAGVPVEEFIQPRGTHVGTFMTGLVKSAAETMQKMQDAVEKELNPSN